MNSVIKERQSIIIKLNNQKSEINLILEKERIVLKENEEKLS